MSEAHPFDAKYHRPTSVAAQGFCSQHGTNSCSEPLVISFKDRHNRWQSGCQRALEQLVARGKISAPSLRR